MSQPLKGARRRALQTRAVFVERYAATNREAAEIILRASERYPGLPQLWAVMVQGDDAKRWRREWRMTA